MFVKEKLSFHAHIYLVKNVLLRKINKNVIFSKVFNKKKIIGIFVFWKWVLTGDFKESKGFTRNLISSELTSEFYYGGEFGRPIIWFVYNLDLTVYLNSFVAKFVSIDSILSDSCQIYGHFEYLSMIKYSTFAGGALT